MFSILRIYWTIAEGLPHEKDEGCYQDPVLWVWLEIFFPLRGTNSKTTHYLLWCFFGSLPLKVLRKLPHAVDLLRLNTLRGTKIETPKRYYEHPRSFYMGVPPPRELHTHEALQKTSPIKFLSYSHLTAGWSLFLKPLYSIVPRHHFFSFRRKL